MGSGYAYGDGSTTHPLDGVAIAPNYSASYDAAGDMTGRGANVLSYDALRRLTHWQNAATMNHPSQTANYAYDGEGERVMQQANSIQNPGLPSNIITTTTTYYIGSFEEVSTTTQSGACNSCQPPSTTTITYYDAGVTPAESVNGTLSYLVQDSLGGMAEALSASGSVTAAQLFLPYGASRYTSGTMPTSYSFTGQRSDPSGLMYFHARYYDPSAGQFISADSVEGPNRFGYVSGNPTSETDPSGHDAIDGPVVTDAIEVEAGANVFEEVTFDGNGNASKEIDFKNNAD